MRQYSIFILLTCHLGGVATPASTVFIVIHGTWGSRETWYKKGGDFFTTLEHNVHKDATVVSFSWSGKLDNHSRTQAGHELAHYIQLYPPETIINLIGHSHGGNVGALATQELAQSPHNHHRIHRLYTLATPVNTKSYMPDMRIIEHFYNLFSLDDCIQPVLGIFGRVYPPHPRSANIRIVIGNKGPDHEDLHSPCIAALLPQLEAIACKQGYQAVVGAPGLIQFCKAGHPHYTHDAHQELLIKKNENIIRHLATVFTRRRNRSS